MTLGFIVDLLPLLVNYNWWLPGNSRSLLTSYPLPSKLAVQWEFDFVHPVPLCFQSSSCKAAELHSTVTWPWTTIKTYKATVSTLMKTFQSMWYRSKRFLVPILVSQGNIQCKSTHSQTCVQRSLLGNGKVIVRCRMTAIYRSTLQKI